MTVETTLMRHLSRYISLAALVLVNLVPILGVLWFGWDVGALVILYWSENLVIGFYTIVKMLVVSPVGGLFSSLFFLMHFGGFCAVHGLFVMTLLLDTEPAFPAADSWPLVLIFVGLLISVVSGVLAMAPPEWLIAFAALWLSHGVSLLQNFFLRGERERTSLSALMSAPYGRVVILHLAIIFGGFAVMALGESVFLLLILVTLKLVLDIQLHQREHRRLAEAAEQA